MEKELFQNIEEENAFDTLRAYSEKKEFRLRVDGIRVRVLFSDSANAPTAEEALEKFLIGRMR